MAIPIRGGTVVNADASRRADVLVDGGGVKAVGPDLAASAGAEIVDAGGRLVAGQDRLPRRRAAHGEGRRPLHQPAALPACYTALLRKEELERPRPALRDAAAE